MLNVSRSTALFWVVLLVLVLVMMFTVLAVVVGWLYVNVLPIVSASAGELWRTAIV